MKFRQNIPLILALYMVPGTMLIGCEGACGGVSTEKMAPSNQLSQSRDSQGDQERKGQAESPSDQSSAEILNILADPKADTGAKLAATHQAAELESSGAREQAIPTLFELLKSEEPVLIVAAAAALARLKAPDADNAVIKAADRLSRDRELEYLRQILYIIDSIGGPRALLYLETVAEGHEAPPIQQTAAQILDDR